MNGSRTNYDKYCSRNPIKSYLVAHFLKELFRLIRPLPAVHILEVGCGEGYVLDRIRLEKPASIVSGIDISLEILELGRQIHPQAIFSTQSVYCLGFQDQQFDLVVAPEILEHLDNPSLALREMDRVGRRYVLLSVPREPLWRMLNIARLAYLRDFGNTPGHIQHWTTDGFVRLVAEYFRIIQVSTPLPWTMVLAEKR